MKKINIKRFFRIKLWNVRTIKKLMILCEKKILLSFRRKETSILFSQLILRIRIVKQNDCLNGILVSSPRYFFSIRITGFIVLMRSEIFRLIKTSQALIRLHNLQCLTIIQINDLEGGGSKQCTLFCFFLTTLHYRVAEPLFVRIGRCLFFKG